MNFFDYIGISPAEFRTKYIEGGYVQEQKHAEFPLNIYSYSRATVKEQLWDGVTSKCRGIIVHRETGEVIARPFEKFHNFGSSNMPETAPATNPELFTHQPVVWEKMDGFLCTLYTWEGVDYIASKGSFHSIHAKWATAWLRKKFGKSAGFSWMFTPVFEGICPSLRIVVNYDEREELVLLAIINKETGAEVNPDTMASIARDLKLSTPERSHLSWQAASMETLNTVLDEEGYVLTWYPEAPWFQVERPPVRLKMKFIEYLRLHRMVTGVSPKRIWEILSGEQTLELTEWLKQSTPWFSKFVTKWHNALSSEYNRIESESVTRYIALKLAIDKDVMDKLAATLEGQPQQINFAGLRKEYALAFTKPEHKEFAPVMFAMLDGKDIKPFVWKMVRRLTAGGSPMIDAHTT